MNENLERALDTYSRVIDLWLTASSNKPFFTIEYLQTLIYKKDILSEELHGHEYSEIQPILQFRLKLKNYIEEQTFKPGEIEQWNDKICVMLKSTLERKILICKVTKCMEDPDNNVNKQFESFWRIAKAIASAKNLIVADGLERYFKYDLLAVFSDRTVNDSDYPLVEANVAKIILGCVPFAEAQNAKLTIEIYKQVRDMFKFWPWSSDQPNLDEYSSILPK